MQFSANVSRCREGEDIPLLNVWALGLRPTPLSQVEQLQSVKRAVGRQVSRGVEVTQEVSTFAPVGTLERCGVWLRCKTPQKDDVFQQQVKHLLPSNPVVLTAILEKEIAGEEY